MAHKIARQLLQNLIVRAENVTGEDKLKQLWSSAKKYEDHVNKRIKLGHILSASDYEVRTFDVLANAQKITIAIPAEGDMISGKFQLVVDGWAVLTTFDGRVITSYGFEKHKLTFEQNEIKNGGVIYEYQINDTDRKILKRVFSLS